MRAPVREVSPRRGRKILSYSSFPYCELKKNNKCCSRKMFNFELNSMFFFRISFHQLEIRIPRRKLCRLMFSTQNSMHFQWFSSDFSIFSKISWKCQISSAGKTFSTEFSQTFPFHTWNYHCWLQDASFSLKFDDRILIFARFYGANRTYTSLAQNLSFSSAPVVLLYEKEVSRLYKPFKFIAWWGVLPSGS